MPSVLMAASEAAPFSKSGGLADVLGSLPQALSRAGEEVSVVLPLYRGTPLGGAERVLRDVTLQPGWMTFRADLWLLEHQGVPYYFVDCPDLFDRDGLYGDAGGDFGDNHVRFAAFSHAVLILARDLIRPDVLHLHDWQAGLAAAYHRVYYADDPALAGTKTVFTIHNLGYQGRFWHGFLGDIGIPSHLFHPDFIEFYGDINFLKAGLVFSDRITTVSPSYAREIQTPEYGEGLDGMLRARSLALSGILNGCDYVKWNPETDPRIARNYSLHDLSGKRDCKRDLLREFGLPDDDLDTMVVGVVSRFAAQKGFDLVEQVSAALMDLPIRLIVLGSGDRRYEEMFRSLSWMHPHKMALRVEYNEKLSHMVEAGSDLFLMPSRYEPCGLNQMYSLRYGTLPLVRATGGLDDTVDGETGFKFWGYDGREMLAGLQYALDVYRHNPPRWDRMRREAMQRDFSWDASAKKYSELYRDVLSAPG